MIDIQVAKRLRAARIQSGFSQEHAAETLGVTFQQIQKYEKGTNRITAAKLFQLARLYEKPIQWFFEDLDGPNKRSKR